MNSIPSVLLRLEAAANHEGGFPYSHTAKASDIRLLIAAYQELEAALSLGQENCDAVYEDLRAERDEARKDANKIK